MRESQAWALDLAFELGLSVAGCAAASGLSPTEVWYAWSVRTGLPTPVDPIPSTVRKRCREVQRGWTEEIRLQAERGVTIREQSSTVRYRTDVRREQSKKDRANRTARERLARDAAEAGQVCGAVGDVPGGHADGRHRCGGGRDLHGSLWSTEGAAHLCGAPGAGDLPLGAVAEVAG